MIENKQVKVVTVMGQKADNSSLIEPEEHFFKVKDTRSLNYLFCKKKKEEQTE